MWAPRATDPCNSQASLIPCSSPPCRCPRQPPSRRSSPPVLEQSRPSTSKLSNSISVARFHEESMTTRSRIVSEETMFFSVCVSFILEVLALTIARTSVQLHNSLIVSLFDTSAHLAPPTPPPDAPKAPPRKRRRLLPYQGEDDHETSLRSNRLKRWTVGMGRRERERVYGIEAVALTSERRADGDEIRAERGVQKLEERGGE